jgi:hypothetical protein
VFCQVNDMDGVTEVRCILVLDLWFVKCIDDGKRVSYSNFA